MYIQTFCLAGWRNDYKHHEKACCQGHEGLCPIAVDCHQEAMRENACYHSPSAPFSEKRTNVLGTKAPLCVSMCRCLYRGKA